MWQSRAGAQFGILEMQRVGKEPDPEMIADQLHAEIASLEQSDLYWASSEMSTLLASAAQSLPATILHPDDLPTPFGLVVFESPIRALDSDLTDNDTLQVSAMAWARGENPKAGDVVHLEFFEDSAKFGFQGELGRLMYLGASTWPFGQAADDMTIFADREPATQASLIEDRKLLHSFFLLLAQKAVEVQERHPQRQERRQAQREGRPEPRPVRVVGLQARPVYEKSDEQREVEWSHRWVVKPHWRRQWYPSQGRHYPKFIMSYVKGPEDLPLVIKDTVHTVK